jgi:uncharacterized membrane protein
MFVVDYVLLFPVNSLFWLFREIHEAAEQEQENEVDSITAQLSELYMMLETGKISEEEFDEREGELLDRLDELEEQAALEETPGSGEEPLES